MRKKAGHKIYSYYSTVLKKYSDVYLYMLVYKEHALGINKKFLRVVPWGIEWEKEQGWTECS